MNPWEAKGNGIVFLRYLKKKTVNQEFYIRQNYPLQIKEKLKHSQKRTKTEISLFACVPTINTKGNPSG